MKADAHPIRTVFGKDVRYIVPLYQRPYVWDRDTKWEPLWNDVRLLVSDLQQASKSGDGIVPAPHFLGAIVLDQRLGPTGDLEVRHVIDGQQRLTTLQLLIAAASEVAQALGIDQPSRILAKLTANDPDLYTDPDHRFKVWPTNTDRAAFRAAMRGELSSAPITEGGRLVEAYLFFLENVTAWVGEDPKSISAKFESLTRAVRDYLRVVVIDLDDEDNAQIIFETLNARTTPLLSIDLVKNLVFRFAEKQATGELGLDALYDGYWRQFDTEPWRREVRQGRLNRPRAEIFLMHWLTMKRHEEVPSQRLYPVFQRLLQEDGERPVSEVVAEFGEDARTFESFDHQRAGTREGLFFKRLTALDVTTLYPLLLGLFRHSATGLSVARRAAALEIVESWLVRRMIARLPAKNYNRYFLDLLQLVEKDVARADAVLFEALAGAAAETNRWPEDKEVIDALCDRSTFWSLAGVRVVMLLAAVEVGYRTEKSEGLEVPEGLTIEHILPREWTKNWPVDAGDLDAKYRRDEHVNRLGNLTLVTRSLNPSMSNAAWSAKRVELQKHSLLLLNRRLCADHPTVWDEAAIDERSRALAEVIVNLWPGPKAVAWGGMIGAGSS